MENPVSTYFPGRLLTFDDNGNGDEVATVPNLMLQVTEFGNGFVEIAFDDRNERVYLAFRISDLVRAAKESGI